MLDKGLWASHAAHGVAGLWMLGLLTPRAFERERGVVLHVKVPASACRTYTASGTTLLRQNARIRGQPDGHLRFVLQGEPMTPFLRCRVIGIYVRIMPLATIRAGRPADIVFP